jgi:hypothetical protein
MKSTYRRRIQSLQAKRIQSQELVLISSYRSPMLNGKLAAPLFKAVVALIEVLFKKGNVYRRL